MAKIRVKWSKKIGLFSLFFSLIFIILIQNIQADDSIIIVPPDPGDHQNTFHDEETNGSLPPGFPEADEWDNVRTMSEMKQSGMNYEDFKNGGLPSDMPDGNWDLYPTMSEAKQQPEMESTEEVPEVIPPKQDKSSNTSVFVGLFAVIGVIFLIYLIFSLSKKVGKKWKKPKKHCPGCGAKLHPSDSFCPSCGKKL